jgi:hypothetical protein
MIGFAAGFGCCVLDGLEQVLVYLSVVVPVNVGRRSLELEVLFI